MTSIADTLAELDAWLDVNWDSDRPLVEWRELLADSGWACPSWPTEWFGRGLDETAASAVRQRLRERDIVGPAGGSAMTLAAPTLLALASDDLLGRLLRDMVTGTITWCQLFSEPGNGSDLAGLATRADRDGDEWIVNGQKLWTTGAHTADYGMLLARTDWDQPKHRGITYFALPMKQSGVEVRGVHQMNGHTSFNEVFLTEARVADANVVGSVGDGWRGALTTLSYERGLGARASKPGSREGRTRAEAAAEHEAYNRTYVWYPQRAGRVDLAVPSAQAGGAANEAPTRQRVADLVTLDRIAGWTVARAAAARAAGNRPGPEGSIAKLMGSEIARRSNSTHTAVVGAHGMLAPPDAPDPLVAEVLISTPAASIAGGTDEIQRNIVGERTLGLAKEPSVDKDVPFREVKINRNSP